MEGALPGVGAPLLASLPWLDQLLLVGIAATRFAFAFVFLPIFSQEAMPPTVRNSIIVAFGLIALNSQAGFVPGELTAGDWATMLLKEAGAGAVIGFFFATVLWAMGAAGEIIDTKVGATIGQLVDPFSGGNASLTATLLSRFAQVVFVSAGGLTLLVGTVMSSYALWPLGPGGIALDLGAVRYFEAEFGRLFVLAFLFAAPALTVLYVIDASMGFLNRFAQQFNVFALALPIKAVAATIVLILCLPLLSEAVLGDLATREGVAPALMERIGLPERR